MWWQPGICIQAPLGLVMLVPETQALKTNSNLQSPQAPSLISYPITVLVLCYLFKKVILKLPSLLGLIS